MRPRYSLLLLALLVPALAHAQRPRLQHEPELAVTSPASLAIEINNTLTSVPPPYMPPTDPTLGWIGVSVFYKSAAPGDTVDIGRPVNDVGVMGDLVIPQGADGDIHGCEPIVTDLTGKIAFIERGPSAQTPTCFFNQKAFHAQNAGAIGVVIYNQVRPDDNAVNMSAGDTSMTVHVMAVQIPRSLAQPMLDELGKGGTVTVHIRCSSEADPTCPGSSSNENEPIPGTHELSHAYPNPFNPTTQFSLRVAETQDVSVAVYNTLGQQVSVLHEGTLAAGVEHRFTIDAADLPSGAYLYRVVGESFTEARSVVLVK